VKSGIEVSGIEGGGYYPLFIAHPTLTSPLKYILPIHNNKKNGKIIANKVGFLDWCSYIEA